MTSSLVPKFDEICLRIREHLAAIERQEPISIDDTDKIKEEPGVYILGSLVPGETKYVGRSKNVKTRIEQLTGTIEQLIETLKKEEIWKKVTRFHVHKKEIKKELKKKSTHILARKIVMKTIEKYRGQQKGLNELKQEVLNEVKKWPLIVHYTADEDEAELLECILIYILKPVYNKKEKGKS